MWTPIGLQTFPLWKTCTFVGGTTKVGDIRTTWKLEWFHILCEFRRPERWYQQKRWLICTRSRIRIAERTSSPLSKNAGAVFEVRQATSLLQRGTKSQSSSGRQSSQRMCIHLILLHPLEVLPEVVRRFVHLATRDQNVTSETEYADGGSCQMTVFIVSRVFIRTLVSNPSMVLL